jgi:hypothetical protein
VSRRYELPEITDNPGAARDQGKMNAQYHVEESLLTDLPIIGNVSHFCPAMQGAFLIDSGGLSTTHPHLLMLLVLMMHLKEH